MHIAKKISRNLNPQQCKPKNALARDTKCDFEGFISLRSSLALQPMICQFYNSFRARNPAHKKLKNEIKVFYIFFSLSLAFQARPVEAISTICHVEFGLSKYFFARLDLLVFILSQTSTTKRHDDDDERCDMEIAFVNVQFEFYFVNKNLKAIWSYTKGGFVSFKMICA